MRYLSVSVVILSAAIMFSFIPLGRTARASDHKPVVISIPERNEIVGPSSGLLYSITASIKRYVTPPILVRGLAEIDPDTCTEIDVGAWTNITPNQNCGKDASGNVIKCGMVTTGTETDTIGSGVCAGHTFTFAGIYYEWTAHNNQSTSPAPPDMVADTFNATWAAKDGMMEQDTFNINVPVVRPDYEKTAFDKFATSRGVWYPITLVPPSSDPTFDFSGEVVQEFPSFPVGQDTCWFPKSGLDPLEAVTPLANPPTVARGNIYDDLVGYGPEQVWCYRKNPTFIESGFCQTRFGQLMEIHAPSDGPLPSTTYTPYGSTNTGENLLGAGMQRPSKVSSMRAGILMEEDFTQRFPSCPPSPKP